MTPAELDAAEALADAALPGPWVIAQDGDVNAPNAGYILVCNDARPRDAAFIAEARTLVPALVAEVRRLRVALGDLVATLPKCGICNAPATAGADDHDLAASVCDLHADTETRTNGYPDDVDASYGAPLRTALALLATDTKGPQSS